MNYTVQFEFLIDDDVIYEDSDIKELIKTAMSSFNCDVSNVRIIDIND